MHCEQVYFVVVYNNEFTAPIQIDVMTYLAAILEEIFKMQENNLQYAHLIQENATYICCNSIIFLSIQILHMQFKDMGSIPTFLFISKWQLVFIVPGFSVFMIMVNSTDFLNSVYSQSNCNPEKLMHLWHTTMHIINPFNVMSDFRYPIIVRYHF